MLCDLRRGQPQSTRGTSGRKGQPRSPGHGRCVGMSEETRSADNHFKYYRYVYGTRDTSPAATLSTVRGIGLTPRPGRSKPGSEAGRQRGTHFYKVASEEKTPLAPAAAHNSSSIATRGAWILAGDGLRCRVYARSANATSPRRSFQGRIRRQAIDRQKPRAALLMFSSA